MKLHLKLVLRNISRNSMFALIKITGLALGLAISLLIGLYIHDELKYDRHHTKANRIYRVTSFSDFGGVVEKSSVARPHWRRRAGRISAIRDKILRTLMTGERSIDRSH